MRAWRCCATCSSCGRTQKRLACWTTPFLIVVPIQGVDGHERFGPYNRINQNGPAEMGWRTSAQNYNLNRDWLKADAPEMRAELDLFHRWLPDLLIDTHTTDGADYQYDLTYSLEKFANQHPAVVAWQKEAFDGHIFPALTKQGHKIAPYITLRNPLEPRAGFDDGAIASHVSPPATARCGTARHCSWKRTCSRITTTA